MKKFALLIAVFFFSVLLLPAQVKVVAPINPNAPTDNYPTHIDSLGHGGFMSVRNKNTRNNIPTLRRKEGMLVYVVETDSLYQLMGGITNSNWSQYKLGGSGAGSLVWKGSLSDAPLLPQINWAYFDIEDNKSYIWDGDSWEILAQGVQGPQGENSIVWKGNLTQAPVNPLQNWVYYNINDRVSYIWNINNNEWDTLAPGGSGFVFDGPDYDPEWGEVPEPSNPPANPVLNMLHRDADNGLVYIYNGITWKLFIKDGLNGDEGDAGPPGPQGPPGEVTSGVMIWLGESDENPPGSPSGPWAINSAYYDRTLRKSFIYDGVDWKILAQDGHVLTWLGELDHEPVASNMFQAYRNTLTGASYFWAYNPTTQQVQWNILAEDGLKGGNANFKVTFTDSLILNNGSEPVLSDGLPVVVDSKIKLPFSLPGTWDPNRFDLANTAPPYRRFLLGVSDSGTLALAEPVSEYVRMSRIINFGNKEIRPRDYLDTIVGLTFMWTYQSQMPVELQALESEVELMAGPIVQIPQKYSTFDPSNPTDISNELASFPNFITVLPVRTLRLGVPKTSNNYYYYVHLRLYNNSDDLYSFNTSDALEINALGWLRRYHFIK
jgi:hypothetical protein